MKAFEIQFGDELWDDNGKVYEVMEVLEMPPHIVATVRFTLDGGYSTRMWERLKDVPLLRP